MEVAYGMIDLGWPFGFSKIYELIVIEYFPKYLNCGI
jgi:hypothetical protein